MIVNKRNIPNYGLRMGDVKMKEGQKFKYLAKDLGDDREYDREIRMLLGQDMIPSIKKTKIKKPFFLETK